MMLNPMLILRSRDMLERYRPILDSILIDGEEQKTANDNQNPAEALIGKKAGKKVKRGQTATLQVRNSDGALSNEFTFTRP